jgi:hypothetical protein
MSEGEKDPAKQNGPQQAGGSTHTNQNGAEQQGIRGPGAGDGAGQPGIDKGRDQPKPVQPGHQAGSAT